MCERIPADALPAPRLPVLRRRSVLAGACGVFLSACIAPSRRRLPLHAVQNLSAGEAPRWVPLPPVDARQAAMSGTPQDAAGTASMTGSSMTGSSMTGSSMTGSSTNGSSMTLAVVPRSAWGAESLKDNHDPMNGISRITLHHTAELPEMTQRTDLELMKGIQNFHRNQREWADIGYHYVIGRDGRVYEGRALDVQGAHAGGGNNKNNLGISLIGDFSTALPSDLQVAVLEAFLREQQIKYEIAADQVFGHRDFKPTECPGTPLYQWLLDYKTSQA